MYNSVSSFINVYLAGAMYIAFTSLSISFSLLFCVVRGDWNLRARTVARWGQCEVGWPCQVKPWQTVMYELEPYENGHEDEDPKMWDPSS